jgi:lysophospholipase L1-like esterase
MLNNNRRNFIKNTTIATIASLAIPEIVSAAIPKEKKIRINTNDVILFQGDSITDWGRDYKSTTPNTTNIIGPGYPIMVSGNLLLNNPQKNLQIYNRGIGGQKSVDLLKRWDADCIAIKPNVLSILVGVNDFWHRLTFGYDGTIDTYIAAYKKLLEETKQALPDVKLIIGEPFAVKGVTAVDDKWYPEFDNYRQAARDLASQYNAVFIPYQSIYDKALEVAPGSYWTIDGVHPSVAGEALMARAWLEVIK